MKAQEFIRKFRWLIIIIIIISIGFTIVKFFYVPKDNGSTEYSDIDDYDVPVGEDVLAEAKEVWANEDSDIEGWTKLDKYNAGLDFHNGADSDNDGLTDKEEIEVYGSDPKKASTSDDLYSDGYKVEHGMDMNTHYEYTQTQVFENNECHDVILSAKTPNDFIAHVSAIENIDINDYTVYKTFRVYSFSGSMKIDISDIDAEDASILISPWYGGEMDEPKTAKDGTTLSFDYDFDRNRSYVVAVVKSESAKNLIQKPVYDIMLNSADSAEVNVEDIQFMFVQRFFILNLLFNVKPHMYYVSTGDATQDVMIIKYMLFLADKVNDHMVNVEETDCEAISAEKMAELKKIYHEQPSHELCEDNYREHGGFKAPLWLYLWSDEFLVDPSLFKVKEVTTEKKINKSSTGFDVNSDAFTFPNFSSEYATGGNCAGIALYTAKLFNTGNAPVRGEYTSSLYHNNAGTVTWDISSDEENITLTDIGLNDYKNSSFVSIHENEAGLLSNLSSGEDEYKKMIAAYWAQANDVMDVRNNAYYINEKIGTYDWSMIEKMMDYLDKKQILVLGLLNSNTQGHAINIVDYKMSEDKNTVYFTLYDNIYPGNKRKGNDIHNTLIVTRKQMQAGYTDSFTYYYKPYDGCKYVYDSEQNKDNVRCFRVMDSNLNIIE